MDSLEKTLSMKGGLGEESYSHNSQFQARSFQLVRDPLVQAIRKLPFPSFGRTLHVADLGCATGSNTISTAQLIAKSVHSICDEIWVFFCDLPSNDFNTLFQQLSTAVPGDFCKAHSSELSVEYDEARPVFLAAGVSGSFYGRLFPRSTLHIALSCVALHWLSRVPPSVERKGSAAWNKGKVWMTGEGASSATVEACAEQARLDLDVFLRCRADELVSGGMLFLFFVGRTTDGADKAGLEKEHIEQDLELAWRQLIDEGVLEKGSLDEFNVPCYFRSEEEVRRAVEGCGEYFRMERMEMLEDVAAMEEGKWKALSSNREAWSKMRANMMRSFLGGMIEAKIGREKTNELFERFRHITAQKKNTC